MKQKIQIVVLLLLFGTLGYFGYQRIGIRMGGTPSSIQSEFQSEAQWFLETIVRDIANAAAYARDVPLDDVERELEIIPSDALELPSVRVHVTLGSAADSERTITLESSFWSPENYVALATELLGPSVLVADASEIALDTLLEPTPATLLAESERLSRRLEANMHDALAHEEAALLLGVFGLREAAFTFRDRRAVLLRMASHLALARAIRGDAPTSQTGVVARALLSALAGRQKELREELASWPSGNWKSALLTFSTEDWRDEAPSEHFLVQLMRFRALMATLGATIALERMRDVVAGNDVEWGRILASDGSGELASAGYIEKQIGLELAEAEEVALAHFGRSLRLPELSDALNAHAEGMFGADGPRVLDWGLWAGFYQRHICGAILAYDGLYRYTYGMPDEAVSFGRQIDLVSSGLELNSIVQTRRSRYVGGSVEDTIGMDEAIALARRYPELVNPTNWLFLEDTAGHMMRKRGMPVPSEWFSTAVLATGALDSTKQRIDTFARSFPRAEALDALSSVAPEHVLVLKEVVEQLNKLETDEDTYDELYARMGERPDYDLKALRDLAEIAFEKGDRLHLFRRRCALDKQECAGLGWELAWYGQDEEALATFEHFVDETTSEIRVCNNASWLVNYYYANGREEEALALAERASDVFCSFGIRTHAHLLERVGRVEQAEGWYRRDAGRYEYDAPVAPPLFGFYYRRARVAGDSAYEDRFESALAKTFPNGLEPLPEEPDAVGPTDGVLIDGESRRLEWAELRGGDVIVGVDGWRARSLDQYDSILSFRDRTSAASDMKIRVWRQTRYIDLEANVRGRSLYVRMRTYGTPGPSYQWR